MGFWLSILLHKKCCTRGPISYYGSGGGNWNPLLKILARGELSVAPQLMILLAKSHLGRSERCEGRCARGRERHFVDPGDKACQVDGNSDQKMLQMGFGLPDIARAPQPKGPRPLRNGTFDSRSFLIALFELRGMLSLASPLQEFIQRAGFETQRSRSYSRASAIGAHRAGLTTGLGKADVDPGVASVVVAVSPDLAGLAVGAGHVLMFPIDSKTRDVKPFARLRLPGSIHLHWANYFYPVVLLTVAQDSSIDVP